MELFLNQSFLLLGDPIEVRVFSFSRPICQFEYRRRGRVFTGVWAECAQIESNPIRK
jgi:hypothetical protein